MDGNPLRLTPPPQDSVIPGQINKGIGGGGAAGRPLGGAGGCREAASTMVESASTEWTDEKHSLYLNSMEASFVNQLYNHEFSSNNLLGRSSRINKDTNSLGSHIQYLYSGQFKVLRGGCWGEVKFERPLTQRNIQNASNVLSRNPWIQRFRSTSCDKRIDLPLSEHLGSYHADSQEIHIGRQVHDVADCGEATNSNKPHACCTHLCHFGSIGSNTEVSDQNFVDEFVGAKQSNKVRKKKRSRMTVSDARDQVDQFRKSPEISSGDVNLGSPEEDVAECRGTKASKID